ncbi:site-2 protease family protein [Streptomyces sulphureus]|uniref:site-2 protease family protein n=1 Tax=Streptomyces sulphureus TaxID=47758 RepID=UPI00037D45FC|nr:site-2 protease family protein [Streptomyces sulphureus]
MADTDSGGKPRAGGPEGTDGEGGTPRRTASPAPHGGAEKPAPAPGGTDAGEQETDAERPSAAEEPEGTRRPVTDADTGEREPSGEPSPDRPSASPSGPADAPQPAGADEHRPPEQPRPDAQSARPEPPEEEHTRPDGAPRSEDPTNEPGQPGPTPPGLPGAGQPGTGRPGETKGAGARPRGGGLLMGRPFGVPVYVAPSWFLVAALITWVFGGQLDRVLPHLGIERYLIALFFAVAFYASVLVHELAHTVAALRFRLPVRRIQLQFFGGVSEIEKEAETPGREFVLAFVGPLLSLVLAAVFYGAMQGVEAGTVPGVILAALMLSNLIVAVFNLLPGLPLDGGRMLRAVVWKLSGRPMTGTVAAVWTGRVLALAVLVGLPLATRSRAGTEGMGGVSTLTDALLAAILAAIIWTGAGNSLRMARLRERLPELSARALTRRAVPVSGDTPLSEALRRANDAGARALVVVGGRGEPLSLVRESAIVGVPEHRRPWVAVSTLAQDLKEGMRVPVELSGDELLEYLRTTPATEYLVVEETGAIYGVLSTGDVERAFVKAMAKHPS